MSLSLYFLRHGETKASWTGEYCGDLDLELTEEGKEMAEDFAEAYRSVPWEAIYCSPKRRAIETAEPICRAVELEMQVREGLREISYGEWEGRMPEDVERAYHDDWLRWLTDPGWNRPTGGGAWRGRDAAECGCAEGDSGHVPRRQCADYFAQGDDPDYALLDAGDRCGSLP